MQGWADNQENWKLIQPQFFVDALKRSAAMFAKPITKTPAAETFTGTSLVIDSAGARLMGEVHSGLSLESRRKGGRDYEKIISYLTEKKKGHPWWVRLLSESDEICVLRIESGNDVGRVAFVHNDPGLRSVVCLQVGKGARVQLLEQVTSTPHVESICGLQGVFISVEADSVVDRLWIQDMAPSTHGYFLHHLEVASGAQLHATFLSLGGEVTRLEQTIEIHGERAEVQQRGISFGTKKQVLENLFVQHHSAPHSTSQIAVRAVLADQAKTMFNGNIIIEPNAVGTEASQGSLSLLLSPTAQAMTLPKLEIGTDSVQCKHGAAVSSLDKDQLFYLRSRGVPLAEAKRMLVEGFFTEAFLALREDSLRERVRRELDEKLKEVS
jgi:hypothetical protein